MEVIYMLLPMSVLFKFFSTQKESTFECFRKYLGLCFINNLLCTAILCIFFPDITLLNNTIKFYLRYSLMSLAVGIIMVIIYKIYKNYIDVKIKVVNETKKK